MGEETTRQFILAVAGSFPDAPEIETVGESDYQLCWRKGSQQAGASADSEGFEVFLDLATQEVFDSTEAIALLRLIFADEVIEMIDVRDGGGVDHYLVQATDRLAPVEPVDSLELHGEAPVSERIAWRTWSGKDDVGDEPTAEEVGLTDTISG